MLNPVMAIRSFCLPPIPEAIRTDFALMTAAQLQKQARLLFLAFLVTTPTAAMANAEGANGWVRFATPLAMALFCLAGFFSLSRDLKIGRSARRANRLIRESTYVSCLIAVMCSAWCVHSWLGAPVQTRIYYPVIIALGAFSTAYCLGCIRAAAIGNIVINIAPMTVLLFTSGNRMDFAAGTSLLVASLFQLRMIDANHRGIINLLELQRRARELAQSDPLTGLLNRRALLDAAPQIAPGAPLRLLLIDIDNFKLINDLHGHVMGDMVLCEVARRLQIRAGSNARVARIGGEEFAILGAAADLPAALALGIVADVRGTAMPHGGQVTISIGVADAVVSDDEAWRQLYQRADVVLYDAKQGGRNRAVEAAPISIADRTDAPGAARQSGPDQSRPIAA